MTVKRNRSITGIFFLSMVLMVVLSGLSIGAIWVLDACGPKGGIAGNILKSLLVLAGFLCITVFIARSVARGIEKSVDALAASFRGSAGADEKAVHYKEFASLAQAAGEMVDRRDRSEETRKQIDQERVRLEAMLRQAQKMEAIGTLAGGIAHDFNNILSPILIQTEMALMDLPPDSPIQSNLEDVLEAGNRARELVKQILAFSRQAEEELQPVRVSSIVKESLKLLRATLPVTIAIEPSIEAESGLVMAESTQIHQVLMNLLTNAYQAMQAKGGVLRVELGRLDPEASGSTEVPDLTPGPYLRLAVIDNGVGMDTRTMDRIFDPYFTSREKGQGTGMGLAVVHGIVKGYGGAVKVTSTPGEGSCFEVFLPLVVPESAVCAGDAEPLPRGAERILLVDDEEAIIAAIQQMLERLGYHVVAMTDSVEAYDAFCAGPDDYDLVISDQTMPGMTGEELSRKLMALRPDLPIILCTGFSHVIDEERARSLGIRKLIMKPVVMREMALTLREVLNE